MTEAVTCPRCGGPFECGAKDARCECFELKLGDELRAQLARDYNDCLCIACLKHLSQQFSQQPQSGA